MAPLECMMAASVSRAGLSELRLLCLQWGRARREWLYLKPWSQNSKERK